jgi:hypothetical protein
MLMFMPKYHNSIIQVGVSPNILPTLLLIDYHPLLTTHV